MGQTGQSGEFNRWLEFRSIQTGGAAGQICETPVCFGESSCTLCIGVGMRVAEQFHGAC